MSIGWIKVDCNLHDKPEVLELSAILGLPVAHVVGCLIRIWIWFDQHTETGNAAGVTYVTLDRYAEHIGFAEALAMVGWLSQSGRVLSLPNFDRHNGKSAKKRAVTAERVAVHRNNSCNADVTLEALPEKRREYKRKSSSPTQIVGLPTGRGQKTEDVKKESPEAKAIFDELGAKLRAKYLPGAA